MKYIVIELQTENGTTSTLTYSFDTLAQAEQKFYQILSFAVVSEVDIHSAVIMDSTGFVLKNECYKHISE